MFAVDGVYELLIKNKVRLDQTEWTYLTHQASRCLNRQQPYELNILYDDLKQWQDNLK
jgi:hypothetical protein